MAVAHSENLGGRKGLPIDFIKYAEREEAK